MGQEKLTLDPGVRRSTDDRLDKLIGNTVLVALLDRLDEVTLDLVSLALQQSLDSNLDPIPSLISVHGVVSSDNSRDFSDTLLLDKVLELGNVLGRRLGGGVTSVTEEVDVDVLDTLGLGGFKQGKDMSDVRVHTTVRD